MADEYGADLVTVLDDEGNQHQFELVDAIETDDGRYVALLPVYEDPSESVNDDGELIILEVAEENGEEILFPSRTRGCSRKSRIFSRSACPICMKSRKWRSRRLTEPAPLPALCVDRGNLTLLQCDIGSLSPAPDCRPPRPRGTKGAGTRRAAPTCLVFSSRLYPPRYGWAGAYVKSPLSV